MTSRVFDLDHYQGFQAAHGAAWERGRFNMTSSSHLHHERCPRCGSALVSLEWDEHVNSREVQDLWRCRKCQNEFITVELSDEKPPSAAEVTKPFFTSLVME